MSFHLICVRQTRRQEKDILETALDYILEIYTKLSFSYYIKL